MDSLVIRIRDGCFCVDDGDGGAEFDTLAEASAFVSLLLSGVDPATAYNLAYADSPD